MRFFGWWNRDRMFSFTAAIVGSAALAMIAAAPAVSATYVVSPDGDDGNAGTAERPWRSVERANQVVQPGDTVVVLPGEYVGTIRPARGGSAEAPITYRSQERWGARVIPATEGHAIQIDGLEHIVFDGFTVDGQGRAPWLWVRDSRHIEVRNCRMVDAAGPHGVFEVMHSEQVRIIDNRLSADRPTGNMVHLRDSEYLLVEGNSFTRVGHSPMQISVCRNVVVRANVFHNDWGRNYEFWATGRILIEDNIITQNRDSARSADSRAKNLYHDGIFRFNRIYDNRHTPLNSYSYFPASNEATPTGHYREPFRTVNSRIYHNTIADNLGIGWQIGGMNISSNVFQNNIFYRNDWAGGNIQFSRDLTGGGQQKVAADNRLITNLFRGTEPGGRVIRYEGQHWTVQDAEDRTRVWRGIWSEFDGNIDADPGFADAANFDYRLTSASEAIDAGRPLTIALSDGQGDVLPVDDGVAFFDGFGIEGEEGDWIMVGTGPNRQIAQIRHIELRHYLAHRLHLDRELTWREGDPVSLPWAGKNPDVGAYEHEPVGPYQLRAFPHPANATSGMPVTFELVTSDDSPPESVTWAFGDGHRGEGVNPEHVFERPGNYGVWVRLTFADGTQGITTAFVKVRDADPSQPLVDVDFEEATWRDTWGYHFKFYRSWLTGFEHVDREDGQGKAMHLFYGEGKRNDAAGALAPGIWEIEKYPYLRLSYRIRPGTPVGLLVTPFDGPDQPAGFLVGGTGNRESGSYVDLGLCELVADDQWHEVVIDLREIQARHPQMKYLYRFQFHTMWNEDQGQEFWFDDFAILPASAL